VFCVVTCWGISMQVAEMIKVRASEALSPDGLPLPPDHEGLQSVQHSLNSEGWDFETTVRTTRSSASSSVNRSSTSMSHGRMSFGEGGPSSAGFNHPQQTRSKSSYSLGGRTSHDRSSSRKAAGECR